MGDYHIVMCPCGCDTGFVFRTNGKLFISTFSSDFYSAQEIRRGLKHPKKRYKKGNVLAEAVIDTETLSNLYGYLLSVNENVFENDNKDHNKSHLQFEYWDDIDKVAIHLVSDLSRKDIKKKKEFSAYEISLGKTGYRELLDAIAGCINTLCDMENQA